MKIKKCHLNKVSIVIPTYNQDSYISKTIESALCQDYPNLEIVVSDDASTDKTEEIIKRYINDKRLKYFKNERNLGRVGNYRKALYKYASGEYVLNLDGDDFLIENSYISKAMALVNLNELIMVFAKQKVLVGNFLVEDKVNTDLSGIVDGNWLFLNYHKGYSIPHLSTLYNRSYAMAIGFYQENILSSDWESILKLLLNNRIGFINEYVGVWRKHIHNESKTCNLEKRLSNLRYIESPYKYALLNELVRKIDLDNWKQQMLKRFFYNLLVTYTILGKKDVVKNIFYYIKEQDQELYYDMIFDLRWLLFRLISKNKKIVYWVFKYILGQESFVLDLLSN